MRWFSPPVVTDRTWLLLLVAGSLLVHALALAMFRVRERVAPSLEAERPHVYLLDAGAAGAAETPTHLLAEMFDPSLLAIPSDRGFSGKLWQRQATVTPPQTPWTIGPRFFESQPKIAPPVLLPPPALTAVVASAAEKAAAEPELADLEWEAPLPATQSVWRIEGALAQWPLLHQPALPALTNLVALRSTRLRVAVAQDGTVRFASVERSSGDAQADAQAAELVRQMRFVPRSDEPLVWGVVRVLWAQTPLADKEVSAP